MTTGDVELEAGESIGHTVQFLLDYKEKGRDVGNRRPPSIFRVPTVCRDLSPRSFTPTVVSIGPLHRQDKSLQGFEVHKSTYLHRLLDRPGSNPEKMLKECVQKMRGKIKLIRECYAEPVMYKDVELARMMVIDGCFILYFTHLLSLHEEPFRESKLTGNQIIYDLVLIENQIPFFVLEDIFDTIIVKFAPNATLIDHVEILLACYNIFTDDIAERKVSLDTTHDHILGLLHNTLKPVHDTETECDKLPKRHSAVELDRAGVSFMRNKDANWALAMKVELLPRFSWLPWFWRKPTLKMPLLHIYDSSGWILRNLVMYEQATLVPYYVTTYMWAMGMLIDTPADVAKLAKSGVLSTLSSDENVYNIIYNICKEVVYDNFVYHQEWQQLDTYYNSYWPNTIAGLKRTYFNSPWNIIAFFAGITLFVFTVIQTVFTIMPAYP